MRATDDHLSALDLATRIACELVDASAGSLFERVDEDTRELRLVGAHGWENPVPAVSLTILPEQDSKDGRWEGIATFVAETGIPILLPGGAEDVVVQTDGANVTVARNWAFAETETAGAVLACRFDLADASRGVVCLVRKPERGDFVREDLDRLAPALPFLAVLAGQARASASLVETVLDAARSEDEGALLDRVAREAAILLRADHTGSRIYLAVTDGTEPTLELAAPSDTVPRDRYRRGGGGLTAHVWDCLDGQCSSCDVPYVLTNDLPRDCAPGGRLEHASHRAKDAELPSGETRSFLAVPIIDPSGVDLRGVLRVSSTRANAFSHYDVKALQALARQTALLLHGTRVRGHKERVFRAVIENAPSPILVLSGSGQLHDFNDAARRLFGLSDSDKGRTVEKSIFGDHPSYLEAITSRIIDLSRARSEGSKEPAADPDRLEPIRLSDFYTVVFRREGGGLATPVSLFLSAFLGPTGKVAEIVALLRDVVGVRDVEHPLRFPAGGSSGITLDSRSAEQISRATRMAKKCKRFLVSGETGTGKELVFDAIRVASGRDRSAKINCATLVGGTAVVELFGSEARMYTGGPEEVRKGLFESCNGGIVFLDEIASLPNEAQAMLLRFLENEEVRRLGATADVPVDVAIVAATNEDLVRAVAEHRFRADLYYRLRVCEVELSPLRERMVDILPIAHLCLDRVEEPAPDGFSDEVVRAFLAYSWPGNVRELVEVVQLAVRLWRQDAETGAPGRLIGTHHLPDAVARAAASPHPDSPVRSRDASTILRLENEELRAEVTRLRRSLLDARKKPRDRINEVLDHHPELRGEIHTARGQDLASLKRRVYDLVRELDPDAKQNTVWEAVDRIRAAPRREGGGKGRPPTEKPAVPPRAKGKASRQR